MEWLYIVGIHIFLLLSLVGSSLCPCPSLLLYPVKVGEWRGVCVCMSVCVCVCVCVCVWGNHLAMNGGDLPISLQPDLPHSIRAILLAFCWGEMLLLYRSDNNKRGKEGGRHKRINISCSRITFKNTSCCCLSVSMLFYLLLADKKRIWFNLVSANICMTDHA